MQRCTSSTPLNTSPVAIGDILFVAPLGVLSPPTHAVPKDHAAIYLNKSSAPLRAPSNIVITEVQRITYLTSLARQGQKDYFLKFSICETLSGIFGHLVSVVPSIDSLSSSGSCQIFSTAEETIQSCSTRIALPVSSGEIIGTGGGDTSSAVAFGLYDSKIQNTFITPSRYSNALLTAVCPYEYFADPVKSELYSKLGSASSLSTEAPLCAGISIDQPATAQGVWVQQVNPINLSSDETSFATLGPDPHKRQTKSVLAFGLPALNVLGPTSVQNQLTLESRVNRPPANITTDNKIYCYVENETTSVYSYFVQLVNFSELKVERISHPLGGSPCSADPTTWAFSSAAIWYIR